MPDESPLLRRQLLVWLLVPLSVLFVADAFVSYWVALSFSQRAYDRSLIEIAREVSLHLRVMDGKLALDMPEAARRLLFTDPEDRVYFEISTAGGLPVAGERIAPARNRSAVTGRHEALYDGMMGAEPVRIVELRTGAEPGTAVPAAVVRVAETKQKRNGLAWEILLSVVAPQILLILIACILVWAGVIRGLSPLERLRHTVVTRSNRDRSPVAVAGVPGEVRPLLQAINGLLARLDSALTLQSRFITDAAHQLKTPLTVLRTQLELALRENEAGRMRQALEKMHTGLERLSRVVSQLLSLARNEPEAIRSLTLAPANLNALALEAATSWVPEALKRGIDLGFEGARQAVTIHADPARLRELFDNLLDNAVRYSREGGRVTVRVSALPRPTFAVHDDGPAIPPQERERVFERFHRLLGSTQDGSGLGLAIAQEIAHIHGAEIGLADDIDGVGNTFSVVFPLLNPARPDGA